jgi:iron complex transport system ATP-binding protein
MRGRHPHQTWFRQWSPTDQHIVTEALEWTDMRDFAERPVEALSGGQRQRAWISMALAQGTDMLLLDEPTTYLDLRYQVEILDLVRDLADDHGVAVGVVLHDLDQAAAVADHVVLLRQGVVVGSGRPHEVLTADALTETYGIQIDVHRDESTGRVHTRPVGKHTHRSHLTAV